MVLRNLLCPLSRWKNGKPKRSRTFDDLEAAYRAVTGARRGRRFATLQVNHAYTVLLAAQFQAFCRDLHTESVDAIVKTLPTPLQDTVDKSMVRDRRLDKGNANPGNLGSDFGRFDFEFWDAVYVLDPRNAASVARNAELVAQRNRASGLRKCRLSGDTISTGATVAHRLQFARGAIRRRDVHATERDDWYESVVKGTKRDDIG